MKRVRGRATKRRVARNSPEAEAWVRVAEWIANGGDMPNGICHLLWDTGASPIAGSLSYDDYLAMELRCRCHADAIPAALMPYSGHAYPRGVEREARTLACLWMALEAAEEHNA